MIRIGQGYDLHRICEGRPLRLGGVTISSENGIGLLGHSDADVLLHAVIDALLGALAAGDIGQWFPDTDERYKGCDSRELLKIVLADSCFSGWKLVNLDCTVITQIPRLAPHILSIRNSIAQLFNVDAACISVKAKTNEGVDAVGEKKAMAAIAVLLLETSSENNFLPSKTMCN